jgi:hypothetical protein
MALRKTKGWGVVLNCNLDNTLPPNVIQKIEGRRQKAEGRRQKAEDRRQRAYISHASKTWD